MSGARPKEAFLDALDLPPERRSAFLDERCGDDASLRERVEGLLAAHAEAETRIGGDALSWTRLGVPSDEVLEGPTATAAPPGAGAPGGGGTMHRSSVPRDLGPGDRVGTYKLIGELGHGGFGTVFKAEQQAPVRRTVALKIVKLGMDTRSVIQRFEAERQALALMDHPNIAKVLDAGATETGRPFFVMELVDGVPVTDYCNRQRMPIRERLDLFITICQAIQHAHQKGVIHRDVKPSNVLVATVDGRPSPKVIDFGIAKATEHPLTEASFMTGEGHVVGTPAYMSPEQITGAGDIDTRTDVYALGALLYELLAGSPPFELVRVGFAELQRLIQEEDPPRPSLRRRTSGAGTTGADSDARFPPDLDWIVMRCLEKERARRYPTAWALALDIERFLDERPVEAAPPSAFYRVRKLARRHRAATTAVCAVLAAVLIGVTGIALALLEANRANRALDAALLDERREAERALVAEERAQYEAAEAVRSAEIASAVVDFLSDDLLGAVEPSSRPGRGREVLVREALDEAARRLEYGEDRFEDKPEVEAAIRGAIAHAYKALGLFPQARTHGSASLTLRRHALGPAHPLTLTSELEVAEVLWKMGELARAEELVRATLGRHEETLPADHEQVLEAQQLLGHVLTDTARYDEALAVLEPMRERAAQAYGEQHDRTLAADIAVAFLYVVLGRTAEAEHVYRNVAETHLALLGPKHPVAIESLVNLAAFYWTAARVEDCDRVYTAVLPVCEQVFGPEHPDTILVQYGVGRLRAAQGRLGEAEDLLSRSWNAARVALGEDHGDTLEVQGALGRVHEVQGRLGEAEALYADAVERARRTFGANSPQALSRIKELTSCYYELGRFEDAEPLVRDSLAIERELYGDDHRNTLSSIKKLGILRFQLGDLEEAEALMREAWIRSRDALGPGHLETVEKHNTLVNFLASVERYEEAVPLGESALALARENQPGESLPVAVALIRLGHGLRGLRRFEEAETALQEAESVLATHYATHRRILDVTEQLQQLYAAWGRAEDEQRYVDRLRSLERQFGL